eukprot:CAMPEP_0170217818 /NCGR_PEP_ID=MMETSP0116_2-20130129/8576_1 /TAXON_ID=400756 /ORGANISM="Durinskia baltica, Strain CSIRO CS-38" /LENGTH=187 /DNA_ID=CAMNT_0010468455 /DNA_START=123 /DNA_END=684 /DNA_ORIENTATION=-
MATCSLPVTIPTVLFVRSALRPAGDEGKAIIFDTVSSVLLVAIYAGFTFVVYRVQRMTHDEEVRAAERIRDKKRQRLWAVGRIVLRLDDPAVQPGDEMSTRALAVRLAAAKATCAPYVWNRRWANAMGDTGCYFAGTAFMPSVLTNGGWKTGIRRSLAPCAASPSLESLARPWARDTSQLRRAQMCH